MKTVGHEKYNSQVMSDHDIDCLVSAKRFIEKYGYSPLFNEIAFNVGITKNQVVRSMNNLKELGMIRFTRNRARGYVITEAGQLFKPVGYTVSKKHMVWGHHDLTDIELETMRCINTLFAAYGIPPSLTEVTERAALSSTSHTVYILNALREKHYIHWQNQSDNPFKKIIERTEKGIQVGMECLLLPMS